jgi:hypothetical protein
MPLPRSRFALLAVAFLVATSAYADQTASLKTGTVELKSATALTFGPEGILFVGDPQAGVIYAIDTADRTPATSTDRPQVEGLDEKIASLLGVETKQLGVNAVSVNPISGNTYLAVARGRGPEGKAILLRVDRAGKISEVPLKDVKFSEAKLPNPVSGNNRQDVITHLEFVKGRLIVAGLSNEEFASTLRAIPFPFTETDKGAGIEIYHGAHAKFETRAPVRTFVPYDINGETNILAAYQCTPLVKIPIAELTAGAKVKGTTIAELGMGNRPLDMIVYKKDGKDYLLLANSARGVMKITTENIDKMPAITKPAKPKTGLPYDTVENLKGVIHLDRFDKDHALLLVRKPNGSLNLETVELP